MPMRQLIEHALMALMDGFFARWPQPVPSAAALRTARIIAHRGECDHGRVSENTLEAFDRAADAGVWGIELDVRWTADRVPVVAHDPDLLRVHQMPGEVAALTWSELHRIAPAVPPAPAPDDRDQSLRLAGCRAPEPQPASDAGRLAALRRFPFHGLASRDPAGHRGLCRSLPAGHRLSLAGCPQPLGAPPRVGRFVHPLCAVARSPGARPPRYRTAGGHRLSPFGQLPVP
ncbi:MAG: hypothetical protein HZB87_07860 [Desulfatitalea sp.]|nr:hypothetical protein [Desulfatitalea sp.]